MDRGDKWPFYAAVEHGYASGLHEVMCLWTIDDLWGVIERITEKVEAGNDRAGVGSTVRVRR